MSADVLPMRPPAERPHPLELESGLTDIANAARLVRLAGGDARYVVPWSAWRIWDGQRWAPDECGRLAHYARAVVAELFDEAAGARHEDRAKLARFAVASGSRRGIEAMVALATTELGIPIQPDAFDADPMLLPVANGAIDLETGRLREHRRADFCEKLGAVEYDPAATDPVLDRFLVDLTDGDQEYAEYLARAAGYMLTGLTVEEIFWLALGPAGSGKSTYVEMLLSMLGGFAAKASFDTFLERRDVGSARPDIASLRGCRMVAAVETARRHRLAEPLLKELVGGDRVTARFLYGQPFTFKPCCKVLLAANDPPTITDTDSGIWRRLRRLPFEHVVERPDAAIKARLTSPAGGRAVLRWAIQGCLDWQRDGLGSCSRVAGATAALRVEMNPVAEYFAAATVTGSGLSVPAASLRASYEAWCLANGTRPVSGRDWASRLRGMGFERRQGPRPDRAWHWFGVGLVADRIET